MGKDNPTSSTTNNCNSKHSSNNKLIMHSSRIRWLCREGLGIIGQYLSRKIVDRTTIIHKLSWVIIQGQILAVVEDRDKDALIMLVTIP